MIVLCRRLFLDCSVPIHIFCIPLLVVSAAVLVSPELGMQDECAYIFIVNILEGKRNVDVSF